MDANVINELKRGLNAAYINGSVAANLAYKQHLCRIIRKMGRKLFHLWRMNCCAVISFRLVLHLSRWVV